MKIHEWVNFILIKDLPDNGVFACTTTDTVLDPDAWPVWSITMKDGVVVNQITLYSGIYAIESMLTWTKRQIAEWVQFQSNRPEQQENCIMLLG